MTHFIIFTLLCVLSAGCVYGFVRHKHSFELDWVWSSILFTVLSLSFLGDAIKNYPF